MGKRSIIATKDYLTNAVLPQATKTYTVIEHAFIINKALEALAAKGFEVKEELYRCNETAEIAQGTYNLNYGTDPDMGMMFAWVNSYDKSTKFKCSIGAHVYISGNRILPGTMGSWIRKHTGTADQEANKVIDAQVNDADVYFNQLVLDKENMKGIILSTQQRAETMGRLYFEHKLLGTEQMSLVRQEIQKPSFAYTADKDSLWVLYNHISHALKTSHPKIWMDQQRMVHWFLTDAFGIQNSMPGMTVPNVVTAPKTVVESNPKQIDLIDSIAEVESEQSLQSNESPN
jgi:hypothetical protein